MFLKKHLLFTPIISVFVLSLISVLVVFFILNVQKNNEIKLLLQEDSFKKRNLLSEFVRDIKVNASSSFDKTENSLNSAVTEISGVIRNFKDNIEIEDIKQIINKYEKNRNIDFVFFNKNSYEMYHGTNTINYLMKITDSKMNLENFRHHMLKNIAYLGDSNLIYWIDKKKREIQLSFFRNIENQALFIGAFSKVGDMKDSIKSAILNSIFKKGKYFKDVYFWFYDYDLAYVYNYYNKGEKTEAKNILEKDKIISDNKILKKIDKSKYDDIYNFSKYNFLIFIKSNSFDKKVLKLKKEYNSKLIISILLISLIGVFLLFLSFLYTYMNDIKNMKLTEEQLRQKIAQEVEKNTTKDRILVHQNKLAAMGEMLGNIAHQWRQPLNNINLLVHFIRDSYQDLSKEEMNSIIEDTKVQIDYMSQTIDDFRNFYQPNKDKINFDIKEAINRAINIIDTQFEKNGITTSIKGDSTKILNYKNEFEQVILNILNNANDAAMIKKQDRDFSPNIDIFIKTSKNSIKIEISNNCGELPIDIIDRIFEPYFTTKFENQGTGIGLYMAKTIIEKNMNGKITVKNIKDGVVFTIILPLNDNLLI